MKRIEVILFASALLVVAGFAPAQAETEVCNQISSLPHTITTQGVYCLKGNLETNIAAGSNAITIDASNVVLDLNGFKLGGLAAGRGTAARGIFAINRSNITIKNGTVRGFESGIWLHSNDGLSQGHLIEDIRADLNTYAGITINAKNSTIRNNQVVSTGGADYADAGGNGILVVGSGAQVLNNLVTEVSAQGTGTALGIYLYMAPNSVVADNRISSFPRVTGFGYGIDVQESAGVIVRGNTLSNMDYGIYMNGAASTGVVVRNNKLTGIYYGVWYAGGATGSYWQNLVWSAGTKYTGGTAYVP